MHRNIRLINFLLLIYFCIIFRQNVIEAQNDWRGYAVYRGGVLPMNLQYHAGLMGSYTRSELNPVIHIAGSNHYVQYDSWGSFINGESYMGIRKPAGCSMSVTMRTAFVSKAEELIGLPYTFVNQIYYDLTSSNTRVVPSMISNIRCDGVVEYVYEWYSYRVGGADNYWNITYNATANLNAHAGMNITPKKQCDNLLSFVSSGYPD